MKAFTIIQTFLAFSASHLHLHVAAFTPTNLLQVKTNVQPLKARDVAKRSPFPSLSTSTSSSTTTTSLFLAQTDNEQDNQKNVLSAINPTYAIPYALFLGVATYMTQIEAPGASQAIIEQYINDPTNPQLGSSIFEVIFNMLGFVGVPLACLILPGAAALKKGDRLALNPVPFLVGSAAAGYGSVGIYMSTTPKGDDFVEPAITQNDLGWVTRNVFENKIFNAIVLALIGSIWVTTGAGMDLLTNGGGAIEDLGDLMSGSALASVSTVDLSILTLTGASLIPQDLKRRGVEDGMGVNAVAASTVLFPVVGLALYCLLRPSIAEE